MTTKKLQIKRYASTAFFKVEMMDGEVKFDKLSFHRVSQLFNDGVYSVELVKSLPENSK